MPTPNPLFTCALNTVPAPVQQGTPADLTFVLNNSTTKKIVLTEIKFTVLVGTNAKNLVTDMSVEQVSRPDTWNVDVVGSTFAATPKSGSAEIGGEGISFRFRGLKINNECGTSVVEVTISGTPKGGTPQVDKTSLNVSKFPKGFTLSDLTAAPRIVEVGERVILTWRGGEASYELSYAPDGRRKTITDLGPVGNLPITDLVRSGVVEFYLKATVRAGGDAALVVERTTSATVTPKAPTVTAFTGKTHDDGNISLAWNTADTDFVRITEIKGKQDISGTFDPFPATALKYTITPFDRDSRAGKSEIVRFGLVEGPAMELTPDAWRIIVSADSKKAYVAHGPRLLSDGTPPTQRIVSVVDTQTMSVLRTMTVGHLPTALALGKDAVYALCEDGTVWRCDTRTHKTAQVFSGAGQRPKAIVLIGDTACVCTEAAKLLVLNAASTSWTVTSTIKLDGLGYDMVHLPSRNWLVVAGRGTGSKGLVTIFDTSAGAGMVEVGKVPLKADGYRCAIGADATRLVVSGGKVGTGFAATFDLTHGVPKELQSIGLYGTGVGIAMLGDAAYVSATLTGNVFVIDLQSGALREKLPIKASTITTDIATVHLGQRLFLPVQERNRPGMIATAQPGTAQRGWY